MDAIVIEGISKEFKERGKPFWALNDVTLRVKNGEIFGLLGPNGAGKTTLLNIIIRLLTPDRGQIRVLGQDVTKNINILEKINFVSGDSKFHWVLRAEDILAFYAMSYNLPKEEGRRRIKELTKFFGIEDILSRKFAHLSTGERMRLIFVKAMLNHPQILLLDEPTLGLDPDIAISVRKEIKRVNKRFGTTIILTSHYMQEVEQLADRIAFIYKGRIVDMGPVEKLKQRKLGSFETQVRVAKILNRTQLKKQGFQVSGKTLTKKLRADESLTPILSWLQKKGYRIEDVLTKRPTLEDYFVEMLKERGHVAIRGERRNDD